MDTRFTLRKAIRHLRTVNKHKYEVSKACFLASIYWQGIKHDFSKYSLTEFIPSVKYYQGTSSPIDAEKSDRGYSLAWLHHRGRNPHHWEYWIDNLSDGGKALKIPLKYVTEMVCDWIGSGRAYLGGKWSYKQTLEFFEKKLQAGHIVLHADTKELLLTILNDFNERGFAAITRQNISSIAKTLSY